MIGRVQTCTDKYARDVSVKEYVFENGLCECNNITFAFVSFQNIPSNEYDYLPG